MNANFSTKYIYTWNDLVDMNNSDQTSKVCFWSILTVKSSFKQIKTADPTSKHFSLIPVYDE